MQTILSCEGVTKRYGRLTALRAVTLSAAAGDVLVIFGRNGAGKSTLIHIAAGLTRSFDGVVRVFDSDIRTGGESLRRRIGLVSHQTFLYSDLTTAENLVFFCRLYGLSEIPDRVHNALVRVGLEDKAQSTVRQLSRGMKQRLTIARAFLPDPELMLLDEPYTGLDENASEMLDQLLLERAAAGAAVVMATHDIERGIRVAGRVAVLEGRSVAFEAPAAGLESEAFRERYRHLLAH